MEEKKEDGRSAKRKLLLFFLSFLIPETIWKSSFGGKSTALKSTEVLHLPPPALEDTLGAASSTPHTLLREWANHLPRIACAHFSTLWLQHLEIPEPRIAFSCFRFPSPALCISTVCSEDWQLGQLALALGVAASLPLWEQFSSLWFSSMTHTLKQPHLMRPGPSKLPNTRWGWTSPGADLPGAGISCNRRPPWEGAGHLWMAGKADLLSEHLCELQIPVLSGLAWSGLPRQGMVLVVKNPPANAGDIRDMGSIPGSERSPWRRKWQPTPVFLPEESHGQRSLVGYNP